MSIKFNTEKEELSRNYNITSHDSNVNKHQKVMLTENISEILFL